VNVCLAWIVIVRNSLPFVFFFFPFILNFLTYYKIGKGQGVEVSTMVE
jgi:hypothetical protein